MAVIKHRPRVRVRAPKGVHPGKQFLAEIDIHAEREVPVNEVTAVLVGTEHASIGSGNSRTSRTVRVAQLGARVLGKGTLPQGESSYRVRFELPAGAPPTYNGSGASTRYELEVRVDIPWWPDRRAVFQITVVPAPGVVPVGKPVVFTTARTDADYAKPYLEASLATDVLAPGDRLTGTFALVNAPERASMEVRLLGRETRTIGSRSATLDRFKSRDVFQTAPLAGGAQQAFNIPLGRDVLPTSQSVLWRLDWFLEIRARIPWARDPVLQIPVTVTSPRVEPVNERHPVAPPSTGSDRVRRVWEAAANETDLRLDEDGVLRGQRGGLDLEIRRRHEGTVRLVGRAVYATPVGIGLHAEPGGRIAGLIRSGFVVNDADWNRSYVVRARERAQAEPVFDGPLLRALRAFRKLTIDDEALEVERQASGTNSRKLLQFIRDLQRVADVLAAAWDRIPPPAAMADAVEAWRGLASRLRGSLQRARMAVSGQFEGQDAEVATRWSDDGVPLDTLVRLRPDPPVGMEHALELLSVPPGLVAVLRGDELQAVAAPGQQDGRAPVDEAELEQIMAQMRQELSRYSDPARAALADLLDTTRGASLGPGGVSVFLPAPLGDPAAAVAKLEQGMRLVMALRGVAGPYR